MLAALLAVCLSAGPDAGPDAGMVPYRAAFAAAQRGEIVVAVLSGETCPPCRQLLGETFPEARRRGWLKGTVCTAVDAESPQGKALLAWARLGKAIPQTVVVQKQPSGNYRRAKRVGLMTPEQLRDLIAAVRDKEP